MHSRRVSKTTAAPDVWDELVLVFLLGFLSRPPLGASRTSQGAKTEVWGGSFPLTSDPSGASLAALSLSPSLEQDQEANTFVLPRSERLFFFSCSSSLLCGRRTPIRQVQYCSRDAARGQYFARSHENCQSCCCFEVLRID